MLPVGSRLPSMREHSPWAAGPVSQGGCRQRWQKKWCLRSRTQLKDKVFSGALWGFFPQVSWALQWETFWRDCTDLRLTRLRVTLIKQFMGRNPGEFIASKIWYYIYGVFRAYTRVKPTVTHGVPVAGRGVFIPGFYSTLKGRSQLLFLLLPGLTTQSSCVCWDNTCPSRPLSPLPATCPWSEHSRDPNTPVIGWAGH